jgi:hypothetical protein
MSDTLPLHLILSPDDLLDRLARSHPSERAIVVLFDPRALDAAATLWSDGSAHDLVRVFGRLKERLETGSLRTPVSGDSVEFVDEGEG